MAAQSHLPSHAARFFLSSLAAQSTIQGQLAAAAYLASSKNKALPGISVTQLTSHLNMHIKDFFSHALEVHTRLYPGIELSEIVPVKAAYVTSTIVHAKWKEFSKQLFPTGFPGATGEPPPPISPPLSLGARPFSLRFPRSPAHPPFLFPSSFLLSTTATDTEATVALSFELGWLLFSLGKCHMSTGSTDPLSAYHLLASLLHLLLALIPEEAQTSGVFWPKLDGPLSTTVPQYPLPQAAQDHLWQLLKAVPAEISKQQSTIASLLADLGSVFGLTDLLANPTTGELTPTGGAKLRNLLNPANLSRTVEAVRNRYASVWATKSYLDDAFYLTPQASQAHSPARATHSSPSTQSSPCRHAAHSSAVPSSPAYRQTTNNIMTPLRGANPMGRQAQAPPQTPMSSQLESVGWLREAVMHVEADSTALARYFDACERSPKNSIDERVKKLCTQVQTVLSASELATDLSEQLQLGQKLYYKMLLAFLEAEERRLQRTEFSGLLSNAAFHTSLLACCLESVFASYSTSGMAFPAILHHLELQPFDFGKVIESFIKHEPHLPQHLKMHFADIESRIVESLAWQEGSPLHALMSEYDAAIQNGNEAEGSAPQRAKAALEQFVKKCLYLGAKRIQDMCLRLLLPSALVQQVWAVVKLVLDKARNLLVGRHLDQLLMCAVYGVCKVNQRPVTFRHIIEQYRRQQGASPRTFREVKMRNPSDPPADIIQFYN